MYNFSYCEFFWSVLCFLKHPFLPVKKKISYWEVLKNPFLRWTGLKLKPFVIYLNVYFWERCCIAIDFISNLKLIYKFIDANQKILKEKEEKSQLLFV